VAVERYLTSIRQRLNSEEEKAKHIPINVKRADQLYGDLFQPPSSLIRDPHFVVYLIADLRCHAAVLAGLLIEEYPTMVAQYCTNNAACKKIIVVKSVGYNVARRV
jgi:hypothetical protein